MAYACFAGSSSLENVKDVNDYDGKNGDCNRKERFFNASTAVGWKPRIVQNTSSSRSSNVTLPQARWNG